MFRKILVANRGEIAVRIIRACRELGICAVAVYSDVDRLAPHVLAADEAYSIGPAAASESYLCADRLIELGRRCGCDAVHPGYGFLAERADFAAAVKEAGLVFIGPSAAAIAAMGDKTEARRRMAAAGVPVVPGSEGALADSTEAAAAAAEIGFPVLLKAAAGGGGKGMRVVELPEALPRAFHAAAREASSAFGDGTLYLEKYLTGPRHIEIQVLADSLGNVVHLGERECSIQRRHQKLIEEAPSPVITPELRERMGAAAVAAAEAVGYQNAGTVEFLFQEGVFYFLEMNTRIQVEHPVTELVTGIDLVIAQIRIAAGYPLEFEQGDIGWRGHAIECRITSEDPLNDFLPSAGRVEILSVPSGPGVRWDAGIAEGTEVSLYYDPMLAKLIVHAGDRTTAIERMRRALGELKVVGVETSAPFHDWVLVESDFRAGNFDIRYLDEHMEALTPSLDEAILQETALASALLEDRARRSAAPPRLVRPSGGGRLVGWQERGWR